MSRRVFPEDFVFGAATSAAQIEGAAEEDGKGESIWDRLAATPGRIEDGSTPAVACDHHHRWPEDVALMQGLGLSAYRFSIAWPRILPEGWGRVEPRGLDFYERLVDALLEAGIAPFATLYHWDLPQSLQREGGWPVRATAEAFAEYADAVSRRLGDRVGHWITHNEPWCVATLGYEEGHHAPAHTDVQEGMRASHHLLLSHGWAVEAVRGNAPGAELGIVLNLTPAVPASEGEEDRDAARAFDGLFNRWYLDPLYRGRYPEDAVQDRVRWGHLPAGTVDLPWVRPGDMGCVAAPCDFLGVNYYSRTILRRGENGRPAATHVVPPEERTEMDWEVHPRGLTDLLLRVQRDYAPPRVFITENGAAFPDPEPVDGRIADPRRVDYLHRHLAALHRALEQGVPVGGYFCWSLLDNFEWAHGYTKRFGLYAVDPQTLDRIPKDSAFWYRRAVAERSVTDPDEPIAPRRAP